MTKIWDKSFKDIFNLCLMLLLLEVRHIALKFGCKFVYRTKWHNRENQFICS